MPYKTKEIANYFLDLADSKGTKLEPMKIQKLVYVAHGWRLALADEPLINERIQAWQYGPVVSSLYHEFKKYGRGPIEGKATSFRIDFASEELDIDISVPELDKDDEIKPFLDRIWEVYGDFTGIQLSNMTHAPGTPWHKTWTENEGIRNLTIDDNLIKEHYREIANRRLKKNAGAN